MTMGGVASATGVLLVLLVATGVIGWNSVSTPAPDTIRFPGWLLLPLFAAVGRRVRHRVQAAPRRFTGPLYALLEGLVLGAISRAVRGAVERHRAPSRRDHGARRSA